MSLFIGIRWLQHCGEHFRSPEGLNSRTLIDFNIFKKGSNKTKFQCCKNFRDVLLYIRAIQGHTGGNVIALELMGHVAIPFQWKEVLFHRDAFLLFGHSWIRISHGLNKLVTVLIDRGRRQMYLRLRADQRPKQNHEDVLLPAHLQELYLSVKDLGLVLSQRIIRLSLTQCQNN